MFQPANWRVSEGGCLVVSGPSGVGKSVMLRAVADLVPRAGQVLLGGVDTRQIPATELRARMIHVAQVPARMAGSVRANLEVVRTLSRVATRLMPWATVETYSDTLGIQPLLDKPMAQLSGGEAQRVGLLRALQCQPDVLLLDEPTASLDPAHVSIVETLLTQWRETGGRAVVWVAHSPEQADRVGTDGYVLEPEDDG